MAALHDVLLFLRKNGAPYEIIEDVKEIAESGIIRTKSLLFVAAGKYSMAVVPRTSKIHFHLLQKMFHKENLRLVSSDEAAFLFPVSNVETMPPFGTLYGCRVYIDRTILKYHFILFRVCSPYLSIKICVEDYLNIVKPVLSTLDFQEIGALE